MFPARLLGIFVERREEFLVAGEWAARASRFEFGHALRDPAINQGLRLEDELSTFRARFEKVADSHADLLPHVLRDHNLIFLLDGDDRHMPGTTVQLSTFHSSSPGRYFVAEASGSRTHPRHQVPHTGFEDQAQHRLRLASVQIVAKPRCGMLFRR